MGLSELPILYLAAACHHPDSGVPVTTACVHLPALASVVGHRGSGPATHLIRQFMLALEQAPYIPFPIVYGYCPGRWHRQTFSCPVLFIRRRHQRMGCGHHRRQPCRQLHVRNPVAADFPGPGWKPAENPARPCSGIRCGLEGELRQARNCRQAASAGVANSFQILRLITTLKNS